MRSPALALVLLLSAPFAQSAHPDFNPALAVRGAGAGLLWNGEAVMQPLKLKRRGPPGLLDQLHPRIVKRRLRGEAHVLPPRSQIGLPSDDEDQGCDQEKNKDKSEDKPKRKGKGKDKGKGAGHHAKSSNQGKGASTSSTSSNASKSESGNKQSSNSGVEANSNSDDLAESTLGLHNQVRQQCGAGDLKWSDELASKAQKWADRCIWAHSSGALGKLGENIASGYGGKYSTDKGAWHAGIKAWEDEKRLYNPKKPGFSEGVGHYTQIVWKDTTHVGCAVSSCNAGSLYSSESKFLVCEYWPQGNILGQFAKQVL